MTHGRHATSTPPQGGCLCGAVRFELTAPPRTAGYCHCTRCQRRTGTGSSAQLRPQPGSVRVTGEEHLGAWRPPDGMEKLFCRECGAHLFSRDPASGEYVSVRLGAFDGEPPMRPQWRQWVSSAAPWEPVPEDGLPRFAERRA